MKYHFRIFLISKLYNRQKKFKLLTFIKPLMKNKIAKNWGIGIGGPYEYNQRFWRGSPGKHSLILEV